jgi:hypothetical protein
MLVKKKEHGVKATSIGILISFFNCLFKSVYIFALSLLEKKVTAFSILAVFCFRVNYFVPIVNGHLDLPLAPTVGNHLLSLIHFSINPNGYLK